MNSGSVVSASPTKRWSASGRCSALVVTYGPPTTTRLPMRLAAPDDPPQRLLLHDHGADEDDVGPLDVGRR